MGLTDKKRVKRRRRIESQRVARRHRENQDEHAILKKKILPHSRKQIRNMG